MQRCVSLSVESVDFGPALNEQLGHVHAREKGKSGLVEEILTSQRVVLHHAQVQKGVSSGSSWVH